MTELLERQEGRFRIILRPNQASRATICSCSGPTHELAIEGLVQAGWARIRDEPTSLHPIDR
jgi:hypothetical protein